MNKYCFTVDCVLGVRNMGDGKLTSQREKIRQMIGAVPAVESAMRGMERQLSG